MESDFRKRISGSFFEIFYIIRRAAAEAGMSVSAMIASKF